jgi:primosomal protein N' (replication factor Y)
LILHQKGKKRCFICHHCGLEFHIPETCPKCQSYRLKTWGAGTQKIKELLKQRFLKKAIFELNQDNTPTLSSQLNLIEKFRNEPQAIFIATSQVIKFLKHEKSAKIARSNLEFSAGLIPLIDLELNFPDYLNRENVFQNLYKLALSIKNELILQTLSPEAEFFKISARLNYPEFAKQELLIRKAFYYPPYSHLIKLRHQSKKPEQAEQQAKILFEKLHTQLQSLTKSYKLKAKSCQILGPAPAFIPQVKGLYEWQIYLKIPPEKDSVKQELLEAVPKDWKIDVEPIDTL